MNEDLKELLQLLTEKKVEYLLVGGHAVAIYGFPRFTGDMDIWFNNSKENTEKIIQVLIEFGFESLGISADDLMEPGKVIQLGYPPHRIDLLNEVDGVTFADCYGRKNQSEIEGIKIDVISLPDLIKNKKASGRTKDKLDLENLEG